MPNDETPRERYRRLPGECLAVAKTMPGGKDPTVLKMALVWHRLTNEYVGATMLLTANSQPYSSNNNTKFSRTTARRNRPRRFAENF